MLSGEAGQGAVRERYLAVLPAGYDAKPDRRYPVLYLLHGAESTADEWLVCTRLMELSEPSGLIVVLPAGKPSGWWIDWSDDAHLGEQALIGTLLPYIDSTFRTMPGGAHRAVAGLSMGGYGALVQTARHPELFAAAASFSGTLRVSDPSPPWSAVGFAATTALSPGAFADPVTGRTWRREHDPASLVERLRGRTLFLSAGTGLPCGLDEASRFAEPDPSQPAVEFVTRADAEHMHRVMAEAGIDHTYRGYDCGAHTFFTFQRGLADAWPLLMTAIGATP